MSREVSLVGWNPGAGILAGKLVGARGRHQAHHVLHAVAAVDELGGERLDEFGVRWLQRPGVGRRVGGVDARQVPLARRVDDAGGEHCRPKIVGAGARELPVRSDHARQFLPVVAGWGSLTRQQERRSIRTAGARRARAGIVGVYPGRIAPTGKVRDQESQARELVSAGIWVRVVRERKADIRQNSTRFLGARKRLICSRCPRPS